VKILNRQTVLLRRPGKAARSPGYCNTLAGVICLLVMIGLRGPLVDGLLRKAAALCCWP
jgi:hypothetical protein